MIDVSKAQEIVDRHGGRREALIAILQECQDEYYHLPREVIEAVATKVGVPRTSVLSIATFFRAFSLKPVGKYPIRVCMGTACHVQGGPRLLDALQRNLGIARGDTTKDGLFGIDTVNCLGCCGLAPVITVGSDVHGKLRQINIPKVLKKYGFNPPKED